MGGSCQTTKLGGEMGVVLSVLCEFPTIEGGNKKRRHAIEEPSNENAGVVTKLLRQV